jgi:hypothetical protein
MKCSGLLCRSATVFSRKLLRKSRVNSVGKGLQPSHACTRIVSSLLSTGERDGQEEIR